MVEIGRIEFEKSSAQNSEEKKKLKITRAEPVASNRYSFKSRKDCQSVR